MRIRTIKPDFWTHPVMSRQSDATKLLALGLLNLADDDGYFYADPRMVRNALRPMDDDSGIVTVLLRDLSEIGYIDIKNHDTHGPIGLVVNFKEHQVINKPKTSKIKEFFDYGNNTVSIPDEYYTERKGKEQGKEVKGKGKECASLTLPFSSDAFASAWSDWKQHRKEIKKPITATSERQQLAELEKMGEQMAIATIRHTIAKGWQGLRQPDNAPQMALSGTCAEIEPIAKQIMVLWQGWGLPLTMEENKAIQERMATMSAITPDQWATIGKYLSARLPEGSPGWQPKGRLKFIQTIQDVFSHAQQWDRKNNRQGGILI